jgi:hypothetical protein
MPSPQLDNLVRSGQLEGSVDVDTSLLEALIRIAREVEAGVMALGPLPR